MKEGKDDQEDAPRGWFAWAKSRKQGVAPEKMPPNDPCGEEDCTEKREGWFGRLYSGLSRSSTAFRERISVLVKGRKLDAQLLEDIEEVLIQADLGPENASHIIQKIKRDHQGKEYSATEIAEIIASEIETILTPVVRPLVFSQNDSPKIILIVGVNGSGKTTTIGKLAAQFAKTGKKVMLAAGDTFRAAAVSQLKIWAERTGSTLVARETGSDAAGLIFDAVKLAKEGEYDLLLIDTAGRLQNRTDLMAELEKIVRSIRKQNPSAPHDVLLVLDGTIGQNALRQVEAFKDSAGLTGLIMTKLDGTAQGGILVSIATKYRLPVHAIGVGESISDLQPLIAQDFARAIVGLETKRPSVQAETLGRVID